jgi:RNA polymerase sigma-70 factor (ECF subfamily)
VLIRGLLANGHRHAFRSHRAALRRRDYDDAVMKDVTMSGPTTVDGEFEAQRAYLEAVAYRMLGTVTEAQDAVQECWLRLCRADRSAIDNLEAWLTRVLARICLDMLGSARARREEYVGQWLPEPVLSKHPDPADRVTLDESVGLALLVVLETLTPAERTAFVLHDVFGLAFDEIAEVVGRTPTAVRKLASRARAHVQARRPRFDADSAAHRRAVEAFLHAARGGDLAALVELLDPDVVWRSDAAGRPGTPLDPVHGVAAVATMVIRQAPHYVDHARVVTLNGWPGVLVVQQNAPIGAIAFTVACGRITEVDAVYNPDKLRHVWPDLCG